MKFTSDKTNPAWDQIEAACIDLQFEPKTRPVSAGNNVEFFSTPLQRQRPHMEKDAKADRLTAGTGKRTGIPIEEKDKNLVAYAVYHPRNEERLRDFFAAAEEAQTLLDRRKGSQKRSSNRWLPRRPQKSPSRAFCRYQKGLEKANRARRGLRGRGRSGGWNRMFHVKHPFFTTGVSRETFCGKDSFPSRAPPQRPAPALVHLVAS